MDKLKMHTPDLADENFKKLAELFPNAVTETLNENGEVVRAIDADVLRQEISAAVVEGPQERYQFTWPDKKKSILLANSPTSKTLRLQRELSVGKDGTRGNIDTENIYIEGDNLEALKILRETYLKKVKMIYIDPPYNTGSNLIYKNDYSQSMTEYLANSGQFDEDGNNLVQNLTTNGRFHTDWLNMMFPRLKIAKDLLSDDGILVCAIDENEVDTLLSIVLKNIFGTNHEYAIVTVVHNPRGQQGNNFSHTNEYAIFVYPAGIKAIADRLIPDDEVDWSQFRNWGSESERTDARNCFYPVIVDANGQIVGFGDVSPETYHPETQTVKIDELFYVYPIDRNGIERKWRYARQSVDDISSMLRARKTATGYEVEIGKTFGIVKTVWNDKKHDANEYGTRLISELVPHNGFTFPKSLWTVYDSLYAGTKDDKDAIILDFFSGSATTAHAVMELNETDGGNRKFILVQVPDITYTGKKESYVGENGEEKERYVIDSVTGFPVIVKDSESRKAGFYIIPQIGEERIRKAGDKIRQESKHPEYFDYGFRVFKVDTTNMEDVYYKPADYNQGQMELFADNIKADRTPEDLLFQVMLDLGVLLSSKIEETEIVGKKVFSVADGYLIACFDSNVTEETVKEIAKRHPFYAVFRDSGMASDSVMTNFEQIFETYSPKTQRKVL
ncbi:MAG: site-specific DNA-methyltransferase [Clostridium sp.]|nr:site-specific DNA-methyltransferase [Acetatifactor muris]MCM1527437.1 site-specific DNA-methyltransferase [Bacteroides sp.]MCM1562443.1 site-specific DNA-methyltransferase [Clostridium sp.]